MKFPTKNMKFPTKAPIKVCDLIENFSIKSQTLVGIFSQNFHYQAHPGLPY